MSRLFGSSFLRGMAAPESSCGSAKNVACLQKYQKWQICSTFLAMVWTKSDPRAINRTHRRTRTYERVKCSMMSGLKLHCSQTTKENTMTIQIDRPHAAHTSFNSATAPTLPAAVWDLPEAESISRGARHVRTLSPVHRNSERVNMALFAQVRKIPTCSKLATKIGLACSWVRPSVLP